MVFLPMPLTLAKTGLERQWHSGSVSAATCVVAKNLSGSPRVATGRYGTVAPGRRPRRKRPDRIGLIGESASPKSPRWLKSTFVDWEHDPDLDAAGALMTLNDPETSGKPPVGGSDNSGPADFGHADPSSPGRKPGRGIGWLLVPLLLIFVALVLVPRKNVAPDRSPAVGKPAPEINLVRLSGEAAPEPQSRVPDGKVALLHFWGTWCPPCRMEYPHLAEMTQRLEEEEGFLFLPVSCEGDQGETLEGLQEKTQDFFASAGIESPIFADPRGVTRRSAAERLEQSALFFPSSMLIDADGKIVGVWEGYSPEGVGQMEAEIERLLR